MRWASALSPAPDLAAAVTDVGDRIDAALDGARPDLLLAFASPEHAASWHRLPALLGQRFPGARLLGCSARGVIGEAHEVEDGAALAVTAAVLPDVEVETFHLPPDGLDRIPALGQRWALRARSVLVLPDPFTCDTERAVRALDAVFPGGRLIGGLASGGRAPGDTAFFVDDRCERAGLAGVVLAGDIAMETIVAQGCRPIGEPMFVTAADGSLLREVDGRRAVEVIRQLYARAAPADRALFRQSLFVGVVMRDRQPQYGQGDFLVRNLLGLDAESGALAVGASLRPGMIVQFHLRDAATSAADLGLALDRYAAEHPADTPASGALLFSCLGRGARLYGEPDHDTALVGRRLGPLPVGGFFCNGEIGPVGGTTFLHGYTSVIGLFRPGR